MMRSAIITSLSSKSPASERAFEMMASTPAICEWMSLPKVPPKISRTVLDVVADVGRVELALQPCEVAWSLLARLGHHVEEQVGAVRWHADDERAMDVHVEGDHPVVDRVEKMRISGGCVLKDQGQVDGQARSERDLERLDALGGRHERDLGVGGRGEARQAGHAEVYHNNG